MSNHNSSKKLRKLTGMVFHQAGRGGNKSDVGVGCVDELVGTSVGATVGIAVGELTVEELPASL